MCPMIVANEGSFCAFGVPFTVFTYEFPVVLRDKEFIESWFPNVAQKLITEGKIKPHGYKVIEGGLLGVKEGWKLYETGEVSKQKLLWRIADTPGI